MTSDLIKRLRKPNMSVNQVLYNVLLPDKRVTLIFGIMQEAADMIEELEAAFAESDADCANKEDRIKELESALKQIASNCPFPASVAGRVLDG